MTKISELFHKVGNWHNKISMAAGFTKAELKKKFENSPAPEGIEKVFERLTDLEKEAVEASRDLDRLKALVDKKIGSNTKGPKKMQEKD